MAVEAGGLTNSPMLEQVFVNPDHSSQVLYQLSELWRDKKLCDATIEVGPVKVYVHRLVLLAACPYLLTVGGQHEVSILEVKLPMTVGLEGLNIFLTYLYDGVLHLTTANLRSVEKLAKILKVASIQKFCQEFRDANRETGAADKLTTDYSLKMTNSSLQIIFAEIQTGELKRESADLESDVVPIKRPRMNLDMLSAALQKKSSQSVPSDSFRDTNRGHSGVGATDELFHTDRHRGEGDSTIDTVTGLVRVKDEPVSDYEEEDDEDDDAGYGDEDSELQGYGTTTTDFVRQAPYDTRPFPDDGMNTSGSKMVVSLPPPPSLQKRPGRKRKQLPSGAQHTAQTSTSDADVSFTKGADASETEEGSVDATKVLKNIVKAMPEMAMNLGTSSEIGDDNKPREEGPVQVDHGLPDDTPVPSEGTKRQGGRLRKAFVPYAIPLATKRIRLSGMDTSLDRSNVKQVVTGLTTEQSCKLIGSLDVAGAKKLPTIHSTEEDSDDDDDEMNGKIPSESPSKQHILTEAGENDLVDWILDAARIGYGTRFIDVLQACKSISDKADNRIPLDLSRLTYYWFGKFKERHPVVNECMLNRSTRKEKSEITEEHIGQWFKDFSDYLNEKVSDKSLMEDSARWYVVDPGGFVAAKNMCGDLSCTIVGCRSDYIAKKKKKSTNVMSLGCMCADGHYPDPMVVVKEMCSYKPKLTKHSVVGTTGSDWIDDKLFLVWLEDVFIADLDERGVKKPVVLLVDGNSRFLSYDAYICCKRNGILLYCLEKLPSSSRPCHMDLFPQLAENYVKCLEKENVHIPVSKVVSVFDDAWWRTAKQSKNLAVKAFSEMGIFPLNSETGISWFLSFGVSNLEMAQPEVVIENLEEISPTNDLVEPSTAEPLSQTLSRLEEGTADSTEPRTSTMESLAEDEVTTTVCTVEDSDDTMLEDEGEINYVGIKSKEDVMTEKMTPLPEKARHTDMETESQSEDSHKPEKNDDDRRPGLYLTRNEEDDLVAWILNSARIGYGTCWQDVCYAVKTRLDEENRHPPNLVNNLPNYYMASTFRQRHPIIDECIVRTNMDDKSEMTAEHISQWFKDLSDYLDETVSDKSLTEDSARWYMLDPGGFLTFRKLSGKLVCTTVGCRKDYKSTIARGRYTKGLVVLACMCANGHYTDPMVVLKRIHDYTPELVKHTALGLSNLEWIDPDLFMSWLENTFTPDLDKRGIKRPVVLLVDGKSRILSYKAHVFCKRNSILLYCLENLPLSCRPCHMELFPLLAKTYMKCLESGNYRNTTINTELVSIFDDAWWETVKQNEKLATKAFREMGIFPLNPDVGMSQFLGLRFTSSNRVCPEEIDADEEVTSSQQAETHPDTMETDKSFPRQQVVQSTSTGLVEPVPDTDVQAMKAGCPRLQKKPAVSSETSANKRQNLTESTRNRTDEASDSENAGIQKSSEDRCTRILTDVEESKLLNWMKGLTRIGYKVSRRDILSSMIKMLYEDKRDFPKEFLKERWLTDFKSRHPRLIEYHCHSREPDTCQDNNTTPEDIAQWFTHFIDFLDEKVKDKGLLEDPCKWFMLDQAICCCGYMNGQVVTNLGAHRKFKKLKCSRKGRNINLLACMCADGHYTEPLVVMNNVSGYRPSMTKHVVLGLGVMDRIDYDPFQSWLEDTFIPNLDKRGIGRPVVLLVDGMSRLLSYQIYRLCEENGIILYCQKIWSFSKQPFRLEVFPLLAKTWLRCLQAFLKNQETSGDSYNMTVYHMPNTTLLTTFDEAWGMITNGNKKMAVEAFRALGIFPLDQAVGMSRFRNAAETDQPSATTGNKEEGNASLLSANRLTAGKRTTEPNKSTVKETRPLKNIPQVSVLTKTDILKAASVLKAKIVTFKGNLRTLKRCSVKLESLDKEALRLGYILEKRNSRYHMIEVNLCANEMPSRISPVSIMPRSQHFLKWTNPSESSSPDVLDGNAEHFQDKQSVSLKQLEASCSETEKFFELSSVSHPFLGMPEKIPEGRLESASPLKTTCVMGEDGMHDDLNICIESDEKVSTFNPKSRIHDKQEVIDSTDQPSLHEENSSIHRTVENDPTESMIVVDGNSCENLLESRPICIQDDSNASRLDRVVRNVEEKVKRVGHDSVQDEEMSSIKVKLPVKSGSVTLTNEDGSYCVVIDEDACGNVLIHQ